MDNGFFAVLFSVFMCMPMKEVKAESQAEKLISIAKTQIGVKERSNGSDDILYNDWYYGRRVNNNGVSAKYAWCAVFVSWCADQIGVPTNIIPKTANTTNMKNLLVNSGGTSHLKGSGYVPKCGDIIFFGSDASEHVGIVDYLSQGKVYYIDGNNTQTRPHGVHYSNCSLSYSKLWGFVTPNYEDVFFDPPTNAKVNLNRAKYGLDQNLEIKLSADGKVDYYIVQIWNANKLVYNEEIKSNSLKIPCSQIGAGACGIYVSAYNAYGYHISPAVSFQIANRLSNPKIRLNKEKFEISDIMEFAASADGGVDYYGLQIWKGATVVYQETFVGHTIKVPCSSLGVGDYGAFISCINESGSIATETIHFRIGNELSNPQIRLNKEKFEISDTIEFAASADGGVDYYGLQIWKGTTVVYQETFVGHTIKVSCSDLGIGNYGAFISCVNSLGSVITETVSFEIKTKDLGVSDSFLPLFMWAPDLKSCKAKIISENGDDIQNIECTINDEIAEKADCTIPGIKLYIATAKIGREIYTDIKSETINATGHNYGEWIVEKEATCSKEGRRIRKCRNCGMEQGQIIQNLGHSYKSQEIKSICPANNYLLYTCSRCGDSYADREVSSSEHIFGNWTIMNAATCTQNGKRERKCLACGHLETDTISKIAHSYTEKVTNATCTEKGHIQRICNECGKETISTLPALGHDYKTVRIAPTSSKDGYALHKCRRCGKAYKDSYKVRQTKIVLLKKSGSSLKIKWRKIKGVNGYQIQYSTSSKFIRPKTILIKKDRTIDKTIKKINGKKKYYIRVRVFITEKGKRYYSEWSKAKI